MTIDGEMFEMHGIPYRVVECWPAEVIGLANGEFITLFWQGAEIARIWPKYKVGWSPEEGYHVEDMSMMVVNIPEPPEAQ